MTYVINMYITQARVLLLVMMHVISNSCTMGRLLWWIYGYPRPRASAYTSGKARVPVLICHSLHAKNMSEPDTDFLATLCSR